MQLIKPNFEILEQGNTLDDIYKHIELCGRTCYKSTDKITVDSAKPFVDRLIKSQHYAMLEHGTIYLHLCETSESSKEDFQQVYNIVRRYENNAFSKVKATAVGTLVTHKNSFYITTNLRVIAENDWWDDLKYICEPTEFHAKRRTVRFVCNRQVSHEFVRHRTFSFAQESTRYCNYTKDKFGNELTFIEPCWAERKCYDGSDGLDEELFNPDYAEIHPEYTLSWGLSEIEKVYFSLIKQGWLPQQAATILPNALKTELIMTGFTDDWNHFFDLRARGTTGAPHPQAKELAEPLMQEFINRKYI